jgi:L-amino acid N-acyltransferase YncA
MPARRAGSRAWPAFTRRRSRSLRTSARSGAYTSAPRFAAAAWGVQLVRACVDWARDKGLVGLRLSAVAHEADENGAARRCYERCGFVAYGVEPNAVRYEGRLYDETLMALRLGEGVLKCEI